MKLIIHKDLALDVVVIDAQGQNYFDAIILAAEVGMKYDQLFEGYHISLERFDYWSTISMELNFIESRIQYLNSNLSPYMFDNEKEYLDALVRIEELLACASKLTNIEEHIIDTNYVLYGFYTEYRMMYNYEN